MAKANKASVVTMPGELKAFKTVLEFLAWKFPVVSINEWRQRMRDHKVLWDDQTPVAVDAAYKGHERLFYFREVANEPVIPFEEQIIYQDDVLLVACKPHFLPVTPGGRYVEECLVNRLRKKTGLVDLSPVHRIDRETAGLVMLAVRKEYRSCYHNLFVNRQIQKRYHALAHCNTSSIKIGQEWKVSSRMETAEQGFRMKSIPGIINAESNIKCLQLMENSALFELEPVTGKRHQLRVHMSQLNMPLMNDRYYPELQPQTEDDFSRPLKLLAYSLKFRDPITDRLHCFKTTRSLEA